MTTEPTGIKIQHRHPNFSPDHTRIVYAAGPAFNGPFALWIVDLRTGSQTQFAPPAPRQDRPSWSPDGTRIAYGSNGDLWVKGVAPGAQPVQLTNTPTVVEERPVWSPDGNTLYFNRGDVVGAAVGPRDIYSLTPVVLGATERPIVTTPLVEEWQPAVSPDGKRLCYLRGLPSDAADLYTVGVDGSNPTPFANEMNKGELNCVWSPDGTRILYTRGVFVEGDLGSRDLIGGNFEELTQMNVANHFDGNADWATNFSPTCDSKAVDLAVNGFARIALSCIDPDAGFSAEPPTPRPIEPDALEVVAKPLHGTLGALVDGAVIYTPGKDFAGTDTFTYTGADSASRAAPATVTVRVGNRATDTTPPSITDLRVSPKRWRVGHAPSEAQSATSTGTLISFRLSEAGRVTLAFQRARSGRRVGRSCVKPTRDNRMLQACTRYVRAGSVLRTADPGFNRISFSGHIGRSRTLKPGRYRLVASARDAAGNQSQPRNGPTFTIVAG